MYRVYIYGFRFIHSYVFIYIYNLQQGTDRLIDRNKVIATYRLNQKYKVLTSLKNSNVKSCSQTVHPPQWMKSTPTVSELLASITANGLNLNILFLSGNFMAYFHVFCPFPRYKYGNEHLLRYILVGIWQFGFLLSVPLYNQKLWLLQTVASQ